MQFLLEGARRGEKCLYLCLAETVTRMIEQILDSARVRRGRVHLGEWRTRTREPTSIFSRPGISGVWDPDRLAQVISNLLGNAVEHGMEGKPITAEVDGTDAATVRIKVRNFGAIPQEKLPTIFEAFKRAAAPVTSSASRTGLGLGLFIAREIARAHGGVPQPYRTRPALW